MSLAQSVILPSAIMGGGEEEEEGGRAKAL